MVAFRQSILWGLGSLFVPFVGLIFAIMHWADAKKPFLISLGGTVLAIIGYAILIGSVVAGATSDTP